MDDLTSFRSIIELWGSREALASDLSGTTATQVSKWWQRDNIPAEYWGSLLRTERARSEELSTELLVRLADRKPAEARA